MIFLFPKWVSSVSSLFFVLITIIPSLEAQDNGFFTECSKPFNCGAFKNLSFPFWGEYRPRYCGQTEYWLNCSRSRQFPGIIINGEEFQVHEIHQFAKPQMMILSRPLNSLTGNDSCPAPLNYLFFQLLNETVETTLFRGCRESDRASQRIPCSTNGRESLFSFFGDDNVTDFKQNCPDFVDIPVQKRALEELNSGDLSLSDALASEFEVKYVAYDDYCLSCNKSGGICGTDPDVQVKFTCYCADGPHDTKCRGNKFNWKKLVVGISGGIVGGLVLAAIVFFYCQRRKRASKYVDSFHTSPYSSFAPPSITDLEKEGNFPGVHHFTYKELEAATHKFDSAKELGDGGFGTVYYGKLKDGRAVAVKRLYEHNYKRVEQFWNEVGLLAHLRHPNLVSLYGYTSRHSRELLLVYEYVSKGTVADHLHGPRAKPGALPWCTRLEIAIETASALTYLHASDVVHRDVKTNNILLDENFSVKVADFGLSRLFPTDVTHVSTAPQGTPGYVDPEYHECYQLTDKSDVFSFGVVLIELISSMPAVDITRHRHEINLSNMAINKIQNRVLHELVDPTLGFDSDNKVKCMITAVAEVAFQCVQGQKDMRPTMGEVYEALKRVKSEDYSQGKAEEMEVVADEVVLLKSGPLTASPDSVAVKWVSSSSVSNASN